MDSMNMYCLSDHRPALTMSPVEPRDKFNPKHRGGDMTYFNRSCTPYLITLYLHTKQVRDGNECRGIKESYQGVRLKGPYYTTRCECDWPLQAATPFLFIHSHQRVRVGSVCKGAARFAFPPPKVGVIRTEPYSSRSTPPLGY